MSNVLFFLFLLMLVFLIGDRPILTRDAEDAGQSAKSAETSEPTLFSEGKALFQQKCGFCHGPDATGATGPDLLHSSLVLHDKNGGLIGPVIRGSRVDKGMPAFQLSDEQIEDIAVFLHETIEADATIFYTNSTANYPTAYLLVGNPKAGRTYFYGKGRCYKCHSISGDLAHIASRYSPVDLERRIAFPSGTPPNIIVVLSSGKKIPGIEIYADRFFVSFRDHEGWAHTYQRGQVGVKIQDPLSTHKALLQKYTDKDIHDLFAFLETLK